VGGELVDMRQFARAADIGVSGSGRLETTFSRIVLPNRVLGHDAKLAAV
jgi:hypothetical protein